MARRFSSLLVQDRVVSIRDMDAALRAQRARGGRVGTNLLEVTEVDEAVLLEYLARSLQMRPAPLELFEEVDASVARRMRPADALRLGAVPLRDIDGQVEVVLLDPLSEEARREIETLVGAPVREWLTLELRFQQAVGAVYDVQMPDRYRALAGRFPSVVSLRRVASEEPTAEVPEAEESTTRASLTLEEVLDVSQQISASRDRDEIFGLTLKTTLRIFDRALLITRSGGEAFRVVHGMSRSGSLIFARSAVGVSGTQHALRKGFESAAHVQTSGEEKSITALFSHAGLTPPREVVLLPVRVRGRTVLLLAGDCGERSIPTAELTPLFLLLRRLDDAIATLVARRRKGEDAAVSGTTSDEDDRGEVESGERVPDEDDRGEVESGERVPDEDDRGEVESDSTTESLSLAEHVARETGWDAAVEPVEDADWDSPDAAAIETPVFRDTPPEPLSESGVREHSMTAPQGVSPIVEGGAPDTGEIVVPREVLESDPSTDGTVERRDSVADLDLDAPGVFESFDDLSAVPGSALDASGVSALREAISELLREPVRAEAALEKSRAELGDDVWVDEILRAFPGPLRLDRRHPEEARLPVERHGPLIPIVSRYLRLLLPSLLNLVLEGDDDASYYALRVVMDKVDDSSLAPIAGELVFRQDTALRNLALEVLAQSRESEPWSDALRTLRSAAESGAPREQEIAVQALGQLQDQGAVPLLLLLLASRSPRLRARAGQSLSRITFQHFGTDRMAWESWYAKNGMLGRDQWLCQAMADADLRVRRSAAEELRTRSDIDVLFDPNGSHSDRMLALRMVQGKLRRA